MNTNQFSDNTAIYLEQYQRILKEMISEMSKVVLTDSISGNFITQMIPHHRAAIAMSKNLLRYTTNIPLQNIAKNIISSQEKSIQSMMEAYPKCVLYVNTEKDLERYEKQNHVILETMFREMSSAYEDNNIDINFIREMIPHHRGAVHMSKNALDFPLCHALIPQLEEIIQSQEKGIAQMQALLRK